MDRSDIEENNAKCHVCGAGLMYLEHSFYGNRCVACAETKKTINILTYLLRAYYDYRIYTALLRLVSQGKKETNEWGIESDSGRSMILAVVCNLGKTDVNEFKTTKQKRALLKGLGNAKIQSV